MFYVIYCLDKPNAENVRAEIRPAHLKYVDASGEMMKLGGPLLSEDGAGMVGSMLIIEAATLSAAQDWAAGDPYAKAGLFQTVHINPWKWVIKGPGA